MVTVALPESSWVHELSDVPGVEAVLWEMTAPAPRQDIVLAVPPYLRGAEPLPMLATAPQLRFVQLVSAGYDHAIPFLPPGVQLANGAGIHTASTAELALTLTLAALRGVPQSVRAQDAGHWAGRDLIGRPSLAERRVLIVGYGSIGSAIARRMRAFEVRGVTAVAAHPRAGDDLVDAVHAADELSALLPRHDVVVVVTPLNEATTGLVDADFLAAMPDGALLVNVARGRVVDTDALVAECAGGRLRAALDVTDPEPLPDGHRLFGTPGVLITPHIGGATDAFLPRAMSFLRRQLTRLGSGEPLHHIVAHG